MNGYAEAEKIDNKIQELLRSYPISINFKEWAKFSRTINSSLSIINAIALDYWVNEQKGGDNNAKERR